MTFKWLLDSSLETDLIARDALAAMQWEATLAAAGHFGSSSAWPSRRIHSRSQWLVDRWSAAREQGGPDRLPIGAHQARRLWRQIIDRSDSGPSLIDSNSAARWASLARRSLLDHGRDPARLNADAWTGDAAAFLSWAQALDAELAARGWIDAARLPYELARVAPLAANDTLLLDPDAATPAESQLAEQWRSAGFTVDAISPSDAPATVRGIIAADPADELEHAAHWAAERLADDARQRLAIVIPALETERDRIVGRFDDIVGTERVWSEQAPAVGELGAIGAGLSALKLLSVDAEFALLSRWLRSPFFGAGARAPAAARVEAGLRRDPKAQGRFVDAYRRQGLRLVLLRELPDAAAGLDAALARLPERATPTAWVGIWHACLRALDWRPLSNASAEAAAWDGLMSVFAELTPIVGGLSLPGALAELESIAASQTVRAAATLSGVHLLSRPQQIGPGYGGAWIAGFSDQAWPAQPAPNPFLPWSIRAAENMPGVRPDQILADARADFERLRRRVPAIVLSCPARIADEPQTPNSLLDSWAAPSTASRAVGASPPALESETDDAPALVADRISGGTRTLDLEASCPVRAFCETRLHAAPLEPPMRGLAPRLRGQIVHRILERLFDPDRASGDVGLDDAIASAFAEQGLDRIDSMTAALAIERRRTKRMIERYLELRPNGTEFSTVAVERRVEIDIGGCRLRCRIDRIDRHSSGDDVLIDYKTGRSLRDTWFGERLSSTQLPIYALHEPVGAVMLVLLDDRRIQFRSAGKLGSLGGQVRPFTAGEWDEQIARWRRQIGVLVDEYAGGDVRIRSDRMDLAGGPFAPLTRVKDLGL